MKEIVLCDCAPKPCSTKHPTATCNAKLAVCSMRLVPPCCTARDRCQVCHSQEQHFRNLERHAIMLPRHCSDSQDYGWSARRMRSWRTSINQDTVVWLGPREPHQIRAHFDAFFKRTVETTGDSFLVSADQDLQKCMSDMATVQGNYRRSGQDLDLKACLTPLAYRRFECYQKEFRAKGDRRCYISDISQNMSQMNRSGEVLPAMRCSSLFYSFTKDRLLLPKDILRSQGWPAEDHKVYGPCLPFSRSSLSQHEERILMGNGMHLAQVGMVFLYIVSNIMKREVAKDLWPITYPTPPAGDALESDRVGLLVQFSANMELHSCPDS